jgi:hypothetical protein
MCVVSKSDWLCSRTTEDALLMVRRVWLDDNEFSQLRECVACVGRCGTKVGRLLAAPSFSSCPPTPGEVYGLQPPNAAQAPWRVFNDRSRAHRKRRVKELVVQFGCYQLSSA